ncbi:protein tyrosine phosphatase type IVA 1 isoform X2 [Numida meleagris]|uniref:protein tyrosine phosphatase type IVA 1 isoform X2 n=1 Tax=Numida meleagris TaxID=8996 RepID=UPI000B3DBD1C|nr:protein tyrosine phosphatase type IVA 1 isoform X2 [Numida meleagris]
MGGGKGKTVRVTSLPHDSHHKNCLCLKHKKALRAPPSPFPAQQPVTAARRGPGAAPAGESRAPRATRIRPGTGAARFISATGSRRPPPPLGARPPSHGPAGPRPQAASLPPHPARGPSDWPSVLLVKAVRQREAGPEAQVQEAVLGLSPCVAASASRQPQSRPLPPSQLYAPAPLRRRTPSGSFAASSASASSWFRSSCPRRWRPHPGCMIRLQSSMSNHIPFCGVLGHTFMEFLKGSGDYCQAQHDLYADK